MTFRNFPCVVLFIHMLIGHCVFAVSATDCRPEEYQTSDGLCCPMCKKGSVVRRHCTEESGTRCTPCGVGTFLNKPNGLTTCDTCKSCDPGQGLFAQQECNSTSNTVCGVLDGYYCTHDTSQSECTIAVMHTRCSPGQRTKTPGTKKTDTVCEDCEPGHFSPSGMNCTVWTKCSDGQVEIKEGSGTQDAVCEDENKPRHHYYLMLPPIITISLFLSLHKKYKQQRKAGTS
ncbi:tumor necrosis factor receptor superfamily member 14-like [Lampris incognitus]|uniref:tumor necrosis factor receptor superfamily member 14-like n=1 Tax=Lampris incognitus TaxID=2546036 RepID=UPI0024B49E0D|nr:tumor necrosis factor receptor superfamily member 14-like [Lampris incognitus]